MLAGPLHVPERKLETAEVRIADDGVEVVLASACDQESRLDRGPRLVDETQVRLDQRPYATHP